MSENIILSTVEYVKHPQEEGVLMKHFFGSEDNDRLNNLEVKISPNCKISPHIHENSSEFYYVVSGEGKFLIDNNWKDIKKGDAMKAPEGMEHGVKNTGDENLVLFSTFSPAIR